MLDPRVSFVDEPPEIDLHWRALTQRQSHSTNVWSDAWLAAFAVAADLNLVTFDRGFTAFGDLRLTLLS